MGRDLAWRALGTVWAVASVPSEVGSLHYGYSHTVSCRFGLGHAMRNVSVTKPIPLSPSRLKVTLHIVAC